MEEHGNLSVRPERRRQITDIFQAARERDTSQRDRFLADACGGDAALRNEVECMLAEHEDGGSEPPSTLGRYRITGKIGEGGMGIVYAATDDLLNREVAVKVLHRDRAQDEASRQRFWREARLAARVSHPRICQLHDVGDASGQLFIAMERLEGESLATRLRRGAVPVNESIRIALDVLEALEVLHRQGIVHRDLKPSNIFLTPYGAKVLDFGVARAEANASSETGQSLTEAGLTIGTPQYMAPEQLMGTPVDSRADLFALGATLYEMIAGVPAFDGATAARIIEQILHGETRVLAGSPSITAADRVVHRALAKSAARRYPTAAAMATDLRMALGPDGVADDQRPHQVTRIMVLPFRLLRSDPDIEFLAFSLADAVANSLSALETLVVRSPLAARRFVAETPDLQVIAKDGEVDAVLTGTLLRAGDTVRLSAQLLEAPAGTVLWSHSARISLDDLFELEDTLVREVVDSLTLPLSGRERQALRSDVPASARAYEFYLRANPLSYDAKSWEVARDLYLQCLDLDPRYAPAWARLGRLYRLLAKFPLSSTMRRVDAGEHATLSEAAFNRALTLNPDLALADSYYAQLELDSGRSSEAMARLVRRAAVRSSDADLFAALVSVCRYCGLLPASFAADERARRLDPNVRTSVTHTCFMAGDYLRAAKESEQHWQTGNLGGIALLTAGHPNAISTLMLEAERYGNFAPEQFNALIARDGARLRSSIDPHLITFPDPEWHFYAGLMLAYVREHDRAIAVLADAIRRGFFPLDTLRRHAWLDPVRARPDFQSILQEAEGRHRHALAVFVEAGGPTLLGAQ
jgi:serine/threonine protein kinase/tetratricopeptide (TPR) repeat protein